MVTTIVLLLFVAVLGDREGVSFQFRVCCLCPRLSVNLSTILLYFNKYTVPIFRNIFCCRRGESRESNE